ncbi:hypothetical protein HK097_000567 [Rhizophlyctis rosea]|uniref:ODAD1 central coiled coil region domain-containing protein n=1 Tax=Rhizophlyctis rosea TaxID=64517 RepID=A0AAD5X556_9FUNG|nr:hypothetical protein HK097_000567 [Rhizophlyctis rosea]
MRSFDKSVLADEELHDLKLRFELLEGDRKAYYETSQWAIRQNKEEVGMLRAQNKELSDLIARLKKADDLSGRSPASAAGAELDRFDQRICELHKKYDELCAEGKAKQGKLRGLQDQLADLKRESEVVRRNLRDSEEAKEIRTLENRLDKATIKYNEAQSIRKTYEQILKRLQDERLTFDNQLAQFEKSLNAKRQDASELEMMSRDANHAKEVAKAELAKFEQQVAEERKQRERDLQLRKELVKQKLESSGDVDWKKLRMEDQPLESLTSQQQTQQNIDTERRDLLLASYEETMRLIKEATGVSLITEVIAKFQSQSTTHAHLSSLRSQNEARFEELKQKKRQVEEKYEELRFSGEARGGVGERIVKEMEGHLEDARKRCAESRERFERVARVVTGVKAGVQHLVEKLEGLKLPDNPATPKMSDETVVQLLNVCAQKLDLLSTSVEGKEMPEQPPITPSAPTPAPAATTTAATGAPGTTEPSGILQVSQALLPAFNTRVKLRPVEFEEGGAEDDEDNDDDTGDIPDRETIKKHTAQMLNARVKTKQPKKGKKKKAAKDEDD